MTYLTGGRSDSVVLTDIETAKEIEKISNIHNGYINVLKFSNNNPNIFATSSFDRSVKVWDLRESRKV